MKNHSSLLKNRLLAFLINIIPHNKWGLGFLTKSFYRAKKLKLDSFLFFFKFLNEEPFNSLIRLGPKNSKSNRFMPYLLLIIIISLFCLFQGLLQSICFKPRDDIPEGELHFKKTISVRKRGVSRLHNNKTITFV